MENFSPSYRISGEYQESLEEINLSGCRNLSGSGLECLWRFKRLKVVTLKDLDHIKELKLICLMLLDIFPNLEIRLFLLLDTKKLCKILLLKIIFLGVLITWTSPF
jgi:hypothetical protein